MHAPQSAVVAVTGGILASVFVAALLALLFICRNRLCTIRITSKKEGNEEAEQGGLHVR